MYQYEAVEHVMQDNGGYATLKHLYQHAPHVEGSEWGTKTPNASIRRIVQEQDRFFKIRPGLWALTDRRDDLPAHIYSDSVAPAEQEAYDHWYFQGLLVEVGNAYQAETWVPQQDKNKNYLDRTLADVRSLETIPDFGYTDLVHRAQTVDVLWFNDRDMPNSFFEVEFSTNFQNSLLKFVDLQDYAANFVIVADETREDQFENRINQAAFDPIRDRVEFFTFDDVSQLHAGTQNTDVLRGLS